ncbi:endonuclease/exonuclease/phosphatase family protein [Luteipulveratus mongoliensis]|uniref:endonuclease/exonuclease/phosphatase family protein n=1 Tax=Luteipulveratus mongoliensis TaxID=571913 RepID=UPI0014707C6E|nr:endonuclease/exonuclease/phosphatase family protein [Luteipulveratus mongoliensis]
MPEGTALRALTYNIHHGEGDDGVLDLNRIAQVIDSSGADIVALQEVDRSYGPRSDWADQGGELAIRLGMELAYGPAIDLAPHKGSMQRRQYGVAILSRLPITRSDTVMLPTGPLSEPRAVLRVELDTEGQPLTVLNTHLQWPEADERVAQAAVLVDIIRECAGPIVLLGDLNASPDSEEVTSILEELVDTWTGPGLGYTEPSSAPYNRIDYILVRPGTSVHQAAVLTEYVVESDHFPYVAELSLAPVRTVSVHQDVPVRQHKECTPT